MLSGGDRVITTKEALLDAFLMHEFGVGEINRILGAMKIVNRSKLKSKSRRVTRLAEEARVRNDEVVSHLLAHYCEAPKRWLAIRMADQVPTQLPRLKPYTTFFDAFDNSGWYGPFHVRGDKGVSYYAGSVIRRWPTTSGTYLGRWNMVACVRGRHVTFHWENIARPKGLESTSYWTHIPKAINELMRHFQSVWREPDLKSLILDDIWEKYRPKHNAPAASHFFEDTYVSARESGISLTASIQKSSLNRDDGESEEEESEFGTAEMGRIRDLTDQLTEVAFQEAGVLQTLDAASVAKAKDAVKNAFIRGWTTHKYECMIKGPSPDREKLFMAKAYFGTDQREGSFQHLKCHTDFGGSWQTAKFILTQMNAW